MKWINKEQTNCIVMIMVRLFFLLSTHLFFGEQFHSFDCIFLLSLLHFHNVVAVGSMFGSLKLLRCFEFHSFSFIWYFFFIIIFFFLALHFIPFQIGEYNILISTISTARYVCIVHSHTHTWKPPEHECEHNSISLHLQNQFQWWLILLLFSSLFFFFFHFRFEQTTHDGMPEVACTECIPFVNVEKERDREKF